MKTIALALLCAACAGAPLEPVATAPTKLAPAPRSFDPRPGVEGARRGSKLRRRRCDRLERCACTGGAEQRESDGLHGSLPRWRKWVLDDQVLRENGAERVDAAARVGRKQPAL